MIETPVDILALIDLSAGGAVCFTSSTAAGLENVVNEYLDDRIDNLPRPENYAIRDFKLTGAGAGGVFLAELLLVDTGTPVVPGGGELPLTAGGGASRAFLVCTGGPDVGGTSQGDPAPPLPTYQVSPGLNESQRQRLQLLSETQSAEIYFVDVAGCGRGRKFVSGLLGLFAPQQ